MNEEAAENESLRGETVEHGGRCRTAVLTLVAKAGPARTLEAAAAVVVAVETAATAAGKMKYWYQWR